MMLTHFQSHTSTGNTPHGNECLKNHKCYFIQQNDMFQTIGFPNEYIVFIVFLLVRNPRYSHPFKESKSIIYPKRNVLPP